MKKSNDDLDLVKSLLLKDLENFYQKIVVCDLESGTHLMVLLKYIKEKKYFDDNFINYWFIKVLNNSHHFDLFVLEKDNYEFFGFTAKILSSFLKDHCSFLMKKSNNERAMSIISKSIQNDCFFENYYLNQFKESSFFENLFQDNFDLLMKKNIINFHNYLNENQNDKAIDFTQENKVKI